MDILTGNLPISSALAPVSHARYRDEIQIFYNRASQKSKDAISVAYLGPSITPFPNLNPGFRYTLGTVYFPCRTNCFLVEPTLLIQALLK